MKGIVILGVFVADVAFFASRQPKIGETLIGSNFALGPGGKGSNQAVAAARLGADVSLLTRLGDDSFGQMAYETWNREGVKSLAAKYPNSVTGAAYIYVNDSTGDNAIIVVPGAGGELSRADIDANRKAIESSALFMTQLETPIEATRYSLEIAHRAGVATILNPAPAAVIDDEMISLCDYLTPNESEAVALTGITIETIDEAKIAAGILRERGAKTVILTLGSNGAFFDDGTTCQHIEPFKYSETVETTGAGDSFCGALAHALTAGQAPLNATRYACAAASISVTRHGTAPSMPTKNEVDEFFKQLQT